MQYLDTISKTTEYLCSFPRQTIQYHSIQVYAPTSNAETPGVTGKFGLGLQSEAGQRLIKFCQENALVIANTLFQQHKRRLYTWTSQDGQTKIRLIIFFAAKDGEALYGQQKQDQELTMAQIMNSLLPNSDLN